MMIAPVPSTNIWKGRKDGLLVCFEKRTSYQRTLTEKQEVSSE